MPLECLLTWVIVIIPFPDSQRVIITAAHQVIRNSLEPLNCLHILCMSFEDSITSILIVSGVEFPNPNIFIPAAGSYFPIIFSPAHSFYLTLMALHCIKDLILFAFIIENPDRNSGIKRTTGYLISLPVKLHRSNCLCVVSLNCHLFLQFTSCFVKLPYADLFGRPYTGKHFARWMPVNTPYPFSWIYSVLFTNHLL